MAHSDDIDPTALLEQADARWREQRHLYLAELERIARFPADQRTSAWLRWEAEHGDTEAIVYLLAHGDVQDEWVDAVIQAWGEAANREKQQYAAPTVVHVIDSAAPNTRKVVDQGRPLPPDVESIPSAVLGNFWPAGALGDMTPDSLPLRFADWAEVAGFDDWWRRLAREQTEDALQGGLDSQSPLTAEFVMSLARSDLALRLMPGLFRHFLTLAQHQDPAWRRELHNSIRTLDPIFTSDARVASAVAFIAGRVGDESSHSLVHRACEELFRTQLPNGGWRSCTSAPDPCVATTCYAVHAICLTRPTGWNRSATRAVRWLRDQKAEFGYWGTHDTYLSVLALDAIALAEGTGPVTFSKTYSHTDVALPFRVLDLSDPEAPVFVANARSRDDAILAAGDYAAAVHVLVGVADTTGQLVWTLPPGPSASGTTRAGGVLERDIFGTSEDVGSRAAKPSFPRADVLLVVATDVELDVVLASAKDAAGINRSSFVHSEHRSYHDLGQIGGARVMIVQTEPGTATVGGSLPTILSAIGDVHPSTVLMVGIAFGIDPEKHPVGQVLVSKQVQQYEVQRVGTAEDGSVNVISRGDKATASPRVLSRLRAAASTQRQIPTEFGLLLSGEKLIDNRDYREVLGQWEPEAIGGEMEGGGLYVACTEKSVGWCIVKAVCDYADGKKREQTADRQRTAATNAATFVVRALTLGGFSGNAGAASSTTGSSGRGGDVTISAGSGGPGDAKGRDGSVPI